MAYNFLYYFIISRVSKIEPYYCYLHMIIWVLNIWKFLYVRVSSRISITMIFTHIIHLTIFSIWRELIWVFFLIQFLKFRGLFTFVYLLANFGLDFMEAALEEIKITFKAIEAVVWGRILSIVIGQFIEEQFYQLFEEICVLAGFY